MAYDRQIETARRLIKKYGGPAKLRVTTSVVDPVDEWNPAPDTVQEEDVVACFLNYEQRYVDGTIIHSGDLKVLLAAKDLTLTPNLQGAVTREVAGVEEVWKVMAAEPLNVNGKEPILYKLQVRQ